MVPSISAFKARRCVPRTCAVPVAQASLLAALLLSAATSAQAQPAAKASRPDPLDSRASVPALIYQSSLAMPRKAGEEKPLSWREANDTVARIGGWRVYAREAQQPDAVPATAPAPAAAAAAAQAAPAAPAAKPTPMPMPAGHGGHKTP